MNIASVSACVNSEPPPCSLPPYLPVLVMLPVMKAMSNTMSIQTGAAEENVRSERHFRRNEEIYAAGARTDAFSVFSLFMFVAEGGRAGGHGAFDFHTG